MTDKMVVGVTGSIGTGKSTFSRMLADEVGHYIDTDELAKSLMKKGEPGYEPVREEFGEDILTKDGEVSFEKLGEIVFNDPDRLEQLESILHPLVFERIANRFPEKDTPLVIVEVPLLFESGGEELFDLTIAVTAPDSEVEDRIRERSLTPQEVQQRREQQLPQNEKAERADIVVENDGTLEDLERTADKIRASILDDQDSKEVIRNHG